MMVKHFEWALEGFGRGRVAIAIDEIAMTVELAQISGNAPPAAIAAWANTINEFEVNGENALIVADKLHWSRKNRYAVSKYVGMSGAINYCLVVEKNPRLKDYPTVAGLHISMNKKLNQGLRMWLGDFAPIYAAWQRHTYDGPFTDAVDGYTAEEGESLVIREVPTRGDDIEWCDAAVEKEEWEGGTRWVDAILERQAAQRGTTE